VTRPDAPVSAEARELALRLYRTTFSTASVESLGPAINAIARALSASEKRGYLRGVEAAAKVAEDYGAGESIDTSCTAEVIAKHIRALDGSRP
jgi:hypothetical protein